jgi:membrane-associated phospholipid phosphatase
LNNTDSIKTARIISILFVPPSFTIIIFTVFALVFEPSALKMFILISTALLFGFILPVVMFTAFRRRGLIADIDARIKEERTYPFILSMIFYLTGLFILVYFRINIVSIAFWFCYISNTLLVVVINKSWKISAHVMGASGPFAALIFVFGITALPFLLVLTIIGWARIKLKCHTLSQVLAGAFLAFISTYVQIYFIIKIFGYA